MATTKATGHATIPRFNVQDGYTVCSMDVQDTGRLAVAGYNEKTHCTFIDLFMLHFDPYSGEKPLLFTSEPYYSKEFTEFGSSWRSVVSLDGNLFLTCCENTIALYQSSNGGLVNQGKFTGKARCMTTRNGLIYVGLDGSKEVIVLDLKELRPKRTITLTELQDGECPVDITVSNNKLFICTDYYMRALKCNSDGELEQEYTHKQYRSAWSITVCEEKGLIFILWGGLGSRNVVVYSQSISGGHILASCKVPDYSLRIGINNNINRLTVVTWETGEVYEYHTSDIFTFDNLLKCSDALIEKDDCQKLLDYLEVPAKESKDIIESDAPFSSLVHYPREAGKVSYDDINYLMTACSDKGLSKLMTVLTVYQKTQDSKFTRKEGIKQQLTGRLNAEEEDREQLTDKLTKSGEKHQITGRLQAAEEKRQLLSDKQTELVNERQQFIARINTAEEERKNVAETLKSTEEERQQLSERLQTAEETIQQLKDTLKATDEERQQLTGRLKTTEAERQQYKDVLKATEEERHQLNRKLMTTEEERKQFKDAFKATEEERRKLNGRLKTTEEERQQFKDTLKATEEERQQLTGRLNTTEEERQQLKDTLKATEEERQQLTGRLKSTEEERQQLKDTLKATEEERQQLTGRLKTTDEERQQFKDTLKTTEKERQQLTGRLKASEEERQQLNDTLKATEDDRQQLTGRLKTTEEEKQHFSDRLNTTENKLKTLKDEKEELLQQQKEELEKAKSSLRATKKELVKSQLEYDKEAMALQEVLKQNREALHQQALAPSASVTEEETLLEEHETLNITHESTLAADYGRLKVQVADDLTLDSCVKLATLFRLPPAETDMLRRVSLIETPGITLIKFLESRNIINMYDVTNLHKGLVYIQLNQTYEGLLVPYQSKVDPFQFEENQSPQQLDWPVAKVKFDRDDESNPSQGSDEREKDHDHSKESLMERTEREELPTQRKDSQILEMRYHHSYIEHRIKYEGGTISIMGVNLTIPEGALSSERVIAVKVIYYPNIPLPGSARRGRMTPLIKLEPEGIALKKPAQLTIPHSAIIPEPDRHEVIIFTGLKDEENLQGEITWTEERSIVRKLDQEKISLDISILSYVFVNLLSQETEQKYTFRIVPFIDGILDAKDDVLITVCFCKDSDKEYELLLEDHHSKLCLGKYSKFPITRTLYDGRDHVSYINLIMSSPGDGYHLTKEESTKRVDIDHLCAASRVSHQFRLTRDKDGDTDMVDVKLNVSQNEMNQTALILQSKVKNILLSPESQKFLNPGIQKYERLKRDIGKLLDKKHCKKLGNWFELTQAENDEIQEAAESGKMLMKILDERELIMPDRMIGMYDGLKDIPFNEGATLLLDYIDTSQEKDGQENEGVKDDNKKMLQIPAKEEVISKRESNLSVSFKTLIEEGYNMLDVQSALKLSRGKLVLGRRILLLAKELHGSNLYKEQYFDQHGGEVVIAGVILRVPAGALHTRKIVSLWVSTDPASQGPISKKSLRLTPFVKFGPESLTLQKPVTLIIPHCAVTPANQMGIDVYSGVLQTDKVIKWSQERNHLICSMNSQHFAVEAEKPCLIGLHVPFIPKMLKRVCVLPIVNRVSESGDQLTIHLWFYNDDSLEHKSLINEEIYQQKGSIIHDPVPVQLNSMTSTLQVSTNSSTSQCKPRQVDVAMENLWLKNRHKEEFHLQNQGIKDTVNLEIVAGYGKFSKNLFKLSIELQIENLRNID
ncbi:uncharacterized protein [Apostichopus japonicus]|uniref:uncharacterized protein isoform X2 n=1 Tax=Stichopus japonicus TaxID=307972 RepID=UPI003AB28BDC